MGVCRGYAGRLLRVDLSTYSVRTDALPETLLRTYLGGEGLVAYLLLTEVPASVDPLSPDNRLILATGPLTGAPLAGSGRIAVGAKSPLTGGFGVSEAGGFFGAELKRAGVDVLVIEGRSDKPVYLFVRDGSVFFRDASHLGGLPVAERQQVIKSELGERGVRICQIGIAGERLVRYASVSFDVTHFAGRCGLGAVMGSKNLVAIAVKGSGAVEPADRETVVKLAGWMRSEGLASVKVLAEYGTSNVLLPLNHMHGLPTRNFRESDFELAEDLSAERLRRYTIRRESCYACPIGCKRIVSIASGKWVVDPRYGGPEYETLAALGSCCGVGDLEAVCKAAELCNAYGLDTISAGVSIAFAMECFDSGLLQKRDTDGAELYFGNADAVVAMVEAIAYRRGLGDLLAQGVRVAGLELNAESLAMHVKGQEIPMHDPRLKVGLGLGYAVSPTGADHCHNMHDTAFATSVESVRCLGILEPVPCDELSERKIRLLRAQSTWRHVQNCLLMCLFVPWHPNQLVEAVRAVTGWDVSLLELFCAGERAQNLARIFNLREGIDAQDDRLPERLLAPYEKVITIGPRETEVQTFEEALTVYYGVMGWDSCGVPRLGKLQELGISWAARYLDARKKASSPAVT